MGMRRVSWIPWNPLCPGDPIPPQTIPAPPPLQQTEISLLVRRGQSPAAPLEDPGISWISWISCKGSCSPPACPQRGAPEFQQEKQKFWETSRAPAQGMSLPGSGPSLSLAGLCHRGDTRINDPEMSGKAGAAWAGVSPCSPPCCKNEGGWDFPHSSARLSGPSDTHGAVRSRVTLRDGRVAFSCGEGGGIARQSGRQNRSECVNQEVLRALPGEGENFYF